MSKNLLDSLTTASAPPKPNAKSKDQPSVEIEGMSLYAAASKVAKEITDGLMKTSEVKPTGMQKFIALGRVLKRCPANFPGHEGNHTASVQLRAKNSASALTPDQVEKCEAYGVSVKHYVIVPRAVIVNPRHMPDGDALNKLIKMVQKAGFPDDFLQLQEEVARDIVSDQTLNDIFALGANTTDAEVTELVEMVSAVTITPKWNGTLAEAVKVVTEELVPDDDAVKSDLMGALKASLNGDANKPAKKPARAARV